MRSPSTEGFASRPHLLLWYASCAGQGHIGRSANQVAVAIRIRTPRLRLLEESGLAALHIQQLEYPEILEVLKVSG
jgi:hypothetical protein